MLLYTIRKCVGDEVFTADAHNGWAKIYSRVLDGILPTVVKYEMHNKDGTNNTIMATRRTTQQHRTVSMFSETKHSSATQLVEELRTAHSTASSTK